MSLSLYVVPFLGIGRKITLDVDFRYRALGSSRDVKAISCEKYWSKTPFEDFPSMVTNWASAMLLLGREAKELGYTLSGSPITLNEMILKLESIIWLESVGYGERESCVTVFLELLASLHPSNSQPE